MHVQLWPLSVTLSDIWMVKMEKIIVAPHDIQYIDDIINWLSSPQLIETKFHFYHILTGKFKLLDTRLKLNHWLSIMVIIKYNYDYNIMT